MFGIGGWELLLIFVIILLVFGAKRLPEIARSLGKATNEFKKAKNEIVTLADDSYSDDASPKKKSAKPADADSASGGDENSKD
jgi:sec-independent protein translocase protein TatA